MIRYYTSRDISAKLSISLAKWKRWSREFLPPDPLGGLQSGFARQYNFNDAFTVFLGGFLVSGLKYTIPEANSILQGLHQWLIDKRFFLDLEDKGPSPQAIDSHVREYRIYIHREFEDSVESCQFVYTIRGIVADQASDFKGNPVRTETYNETIIRQEMRAALPLLTDGKKVLEISTIHRYFRERLN